MGGSVGEGGFDGETGGGDVLVEGGLGGGVTSGTAPVAIWLRVSIWPRIWLSWAENFAVSSGVRVRRAREATSEILIWGADICSKE